MDHCKEQPPAAIPAPGKQLGAALLSYGWGENAEAEAIHFITQQPDGSYQWELMLYSGFGFAGRPTDVEAAVITANAATFYSGPRTQFDVAEYKFSTDYTDWHGREMLFPCLSVFIRVEYLSQSSSGVMPWRRNQAWLSNSGPSPSIR